jgi:4-diphosphocytidyl-2-C-methyl-D-erythritol kinase
MMNEVRISAPAKINLILRVLDRRADGYHNLWSLMHTVGVEDEIQIRLRPDSEGIRLDCDDPGLPTDGTNLIVRAAGLTLERAGLSVGLDIRLVKRIPVSAGLGGGSSDAAATIFGLNTLLALRWSTGRMAEIGQVLGSDVPFFFFAPSAQVAGRGEQVAPLRVGGERWVVLVNPGFPIETRWAYDRLASARHLAPGLSPTIAALTQTTQASWEDILPAMENDFEAALAPTHPILEAMKQALLAEGAERAMLSGSGATVFGIFRDERSAVRARDAVKRAHGWWTAAGQAGASPFACHKAFALHSGCDDSSPTLSPR